MWPTGTDVSQAWSKVSQFSEIQLYTFIINSIVPNISKPMIDNWSKVSLGHAVPAYVYFMVVSVAKSVYSKQRNYFENARQCN